MQLKFYPYTLQLKKQFTISAHSRSSTPAVIVEVEQDGITGYGEASLPPYLKEDQFSVINFLNKVDLSDFNEHSRLDEILDYINNIEEGNNTAKASVDIALHDLICKILKVPLYKYFSIEKRKDIFTSFTIDISGIDKLNKKIQEASEFKYLKVKLGTKEDRKIIETIRSFTSVPIFVDVNQGWTDKYYALEMTNWFSTQNVILVEQPMNKEKIDDLIWLSERSHLPIIGDEGIQKYGDLESAENIYSGVNIKLMKAGGIREAYRMILKAKSLNMKVMLGCMTETSCAITAASHLASIADWVDLDGAEWITNDLFTGMKIEKGQLIIPVLPGIGLEKL